MSKISLKGLVDEDLANYKKPSMYIIFPNCTFKCGRANCQNSALAHEEKVEIDIEYLVQRYLNNPITKAIVCGGLEPMDSFEELFSLIQEIRKYSNDDNVIYSGYEEDEVLDKINQLVRFSNIIIKFGSIFQKKSLTLMRNWVLH
jgi:uncharacterized Fe-S radical SAM superfamily protein PflX